LDFYSKLNSGEFIPKMDPVLYKNEKSLIVSTLQNGNEQDVEFAVNTILGEFGRLKKKLIKQENDKVNIQFLNPRNSSFLASLLFLIYTIELFHPISALMTMETKFKTRIINYSTMQ
jgi:hypothetical protein